jgi:hypothetical protein
VTISRVLRNVQRSHTGRAPLRFNLLSFKITVALFLGHNPLGGTPGRIPQGDVQPIELDWGHRARTVVLVEAVVISSAFRAETAIRVGGYHE